MEVDESRLLFLRELSRRHDSFLVWKHLDRALLGRGDVDAAAAPAALSRVTLDAVELAPGLLGASHVIVCDHVADKRLQFFVQPERLPQLFELDLCLQPSRGLSPWASPAEMLMLAQVRADGIRSLRPGAEAVISLVYHGFSGTGAYRLADDELAIVQRGLDVDPLGIREACAVLPPGPARAPLLDVVEHVASGTWSRVDATRLFASFMIAGLLSPGFTLRRVGFRMSLASGRECVMHRLARAYGRRVPGGDVAGLLDAARGDGHDVRAL